MPGLEPPSMNGMSPDVGSRDGQVAGTTVTEDDWPNKKTQSTKSGSNRILQYAEV